MRLIKKTVLLSSFLFAFCLLEPTGAEAASRYVRQGASGNGSDWANAYGSLPATLVRGDTYYIADGSYGPYTFDDAVSGTAVITVKKATAADHGTDSGWNAAYGDGQAVFTSSGKVWNFGPSTKYYHIDGQVGSGKNGYGFRITSTASRDTSVALLGTDTSGLYANTGDHYNIIIEHVEFDWNNGKPAGPCSAAVAVALRAAKPSSNITFSDCYVHHASGGAMYFSGGKNYTINNSYFYQMGDETFGGACPGAPDHRHWETFWFTNIDDITISNNVFENAYPNGQTGWVMFGGTNNVRLYNNIFYCSEERACAVGGNGIISSWTAYSNQDIYIYHNTFVDLWDGGKFLFQQGSGFYARNNLYYSPSFNCALSVQSHAACGGGQSCCGTEVQTGITSSIFKSYSGDDFRLASRTAKGMELGPPYDKDRNGNARVNWDRGAYEYGGIVTTCIPNWQCSAWSACASGQQTRTCTDMNNCGTTSGKPAENQTCFSDGNLLVNGDFESGFTNGLANSWNLAKDGTVTAVLTQDTGYQGSAQKISIASPGTWGLFFHQNPPMIINQSYAWSFRYKTNGGELWAEVSDAQANNVLSRTKLPDTNNQWQDKTIYFNYTNTAATQLRFSSGQTGTYWLDDISLKEGASPVKKGDLNSDNKVDVTDLGMLLGSWNIAACPEPCRGDLNQDGKVDVTDLGMLLSNWG